MNIKSKSSAGGADITGIDLRNIPSAQTLTAIKDAFLKYGVIAIRGQNLSDQDQFRFCELMGGTATRGKPSDRRNDNADAKYGGAVHLVTNLTEDGRPLGSFGDGEVWFHHDGSFKEIPYAATVLYGMAVTSVGGETVFANMYMAYDRLSGQMKKRLARLKALNIYDYAATGRVDLDQDTSKINQWIHPVVIRHPGTGKKALYVSPLITARIEDVPGVESDALLKELFTYIQYDEIMFQHKWAVGDLVMMDNRCITHARMDFPPGEARMLRRTMVEGVPVGA
ncbi:MAG: TauD/TfdA family dioxygenase [Pseudomonadota bacterium]|nr:TauD/TfdA family dioxygenase [Pseudomonadota bacterium]